MPNAAEERSGRLRRPPGWGGEACDRPARCASLACCLGGADDGAVNTVVLDGGRRSGHNTDWWGFAEGFRRGLPDADLSSAVQLGAGGAGVATAYAALSFGLQRLIGFDREGGRAQALARLLSPLFPNGQVAAGTDLAAEMKRTAGHIHTTPTGMVKYPGLPLDAELLSPEHCRYRLFPAGDDAPQGGQTARLPKGSTAAAWQCFRQSPPFGCLPVSNRMRHGCSSISGRWPADHRQWEFD